MLKRVPLVALLLALVGLVAAPAVQASDAGLRKVIQKQEKKLEAASEKFKKASDAAEDPSEYPAVIEASANMRKAGTAFKKALTPVSASSADGKKGKAKMIAALKAFDTGLVQFEAFMERASEGATKSELKSSLKKLEKQLDKAGELEDEAHALLGLESEED